MGMSATFEPKSAKDLCRPLASLADELVDQHQSAARHNRTRERCDTEHQQKVLQGSAAIRDSQAMNACGTISPM